MPGAILDYLRQDLKKADTAGDLILPERDRGALDKIIILLRSQTGNDFSQYKKNSLYRRIERRMSIHQISRIADYVRYLQENYHEVELLFKELLIGVTSFFRDEAEWDHLRHRAIPMLLEKLQGRETTIKAWSAGCSTGEEAYSLAMVLREALEQVKPGKKPIVNIFATDLDEATVNQARQGLYPEGIAADVSPERLDRFFVKEGNRYRIAREIREMVTFAAQNVIMDPPFTRLDILVCRNLLIYLSAEIQKKLLPLFHYSLNPGGILFLGSSESANDFTHLFESLDRSSRLYRRVEGFCMNEPAGATSIFAPLTPLLPKELVSVKPPVNLQSFADQFLLQRFSPPAVMVNNRGDILYISGRTGAYLEPAAGKANWNIFAMTREGIRFDLESAFQKALKHSGPVCVRGLVAENGNNKKRVDITVQVIEGTTEFQGLVMIVFNEVPEPIETAVKAGATSAPPAPHSRVLELEQELGRLREELRTVREEMQSSQEEFRSATEELQSTNEELQSTNEELTTSREEMQSMNEELQTINAEQQFKMDELSRVNDDMRNLLNSTEIVTVFLDNDLHIRRFTPGADKIFKLIPGDVGRSLSDIVSDLVYPKMIEDAQEVLRTLVFSEKQIIATDGRWFSVRIMPYRTMDEVIAGVVITFSNITEAKVLEEELRLEIAGLRDRLKG